MIYTILISIVFIAELIIAISIIQNLLKLDYKILKLDSYFSESKLSIQEICSLSRKITKQWIILAQDFVDKTQQKSEDFLLKQISKMLVCLLVLNLNFKIIRDFKNSTLGKNLSKGWSLIENMI